MSIDHPDNRAGYQVPNYDAAIPRAGNAYSSLANAKHSTSSLCPSKDSLPLSRCEVPYVDLIIG